MLSQILVARPIISVYLAVFYTVRLACFANENTSRFIIWWKQSYLQRNWWMVSVSANQINAVNGLQNRRRHFEKMYKGAGIRVEPNFSTRIIPFPFNKG